MIPVAFVVVVVGLVLVGAMLASASQGVDQIAAHPFLTLLIIAGIVALAAALKTDEKYDWYRKSKFGKKFPPPLDRDGNPTNPNSPPEDGRGRDGRSP
jgi:hypothetical protein